MRFAEKVWALIRHAGSAPEASIGSKPIGSELVDIRASLAPKCQGFLDRPDAPSRLGGWIVLRRRSIQAFDIIHGFIGQGRDLAGLRRKGAGR